MFLSSIKKIVKTQPNAILEIFKNCGHVVNIENPEKFNSTSIKFLKNKNPWLIIIFNQIKGMKKSDYFILTSAFLSFLLSIYLWFSGQQDQALYVGLLVPSILSAGAYIKQNNK